MLLLLFREHFAEQLPARTIEPHHSQLTYRGIVVRAIVKSDPRQQHIQFQNLHVQDNKLYIKGIAPSEDAKDKFWDQIKLVNPAADDITADLSVDQSRTMGAAAGGGQPQGSQTYTVKSGDTLSKISKQFYGDANEYMRIFYVNRETLRDPDRIQVGQQLAIPPDDKA